MKNILSILIIALQSIFVVNAQQYQQGDIEANIFIDGVHDSSSCASFPTSFSNFIVTVSNSFVGDTLLVKQFYPSYLISTEVNTTGQNPWIINLPIMYMNAQGMSTPDGTIEDYYINGGLCPIQTIAYKLINGNDSIDGAYGLTGVAVPNPCSYSSISGATYADYNANCVFDATDGTFINYQVQIANSYNSNYLQFGTNTLFTNNMTLFGQYTVNLQQSYLTSCTVSYNNGMLPFAYPNSCSPGIYTFNTLPQANIDFALQCTSNIDVYAFGGTGPVRPGIPFIFNPHVGNLGCDTISGWVKVVLDNRVTYNASLSSNPPTAIVGDTMYWTHGPISNISNNGFWNGFYSGLHLTPDTTVNIGDTLCFYIATGVALADIHPYNNVRNICVPVVNSYDPNTKEVMPRGIGAAGVIPPTQDELTYTIHFQNTGNASAINVKIVDTLDAHIIPQSLIILGRSHAMTPQWLAPGVVRFNFNNINLPDSNANEPLSHGYVTFIVMLNDTLPLGTEIENKAGIYFDFNAPIITNTTLNTVDILTETKYQTISENISIYPNPAHDQLTLRISNFKNDKNSFVEIYNLSGKLVLSQTIVNSSTLLDLAKFDKGLYILKSNVMGEIHTSKFVVK